MQAITEVSKSHKSLPAGHGRTEPFFKPVIQPKLTINQPNDVYEQEADAMADKVMRMPMNDQFFSPKTPSVSHLQRKCAHCEEEEKLHLKKNPSQPIQTSSDISSYVNTLSSKGSPLSEKSRNFFEPRFGYDFSDVKIHNDGEAAKSAQSINALAYTTGNNIVFNKNMFSSENESGKELLAHELTHVVQQHSDNKPVQRIIQRRTTSKDRELRRHGAELKAADAASLIKRSLPFVSEHINASQVQQMQRVLDAAVVNPVIQKEADDLDRKSVTARSGAIQIKDPKMVAKEDRVMESYTYIAEMDKRIRLDFKTLLTADALLPTTDNADEVAYLGKVKKTLETSGVWLRYSAKLVRNPEDLSQWIIDQREFDVWLSIGSGGDMIPTKTGQIDRKAILGTTIFGAGYFTNVDFGPIESDLKKGITKIEDEIDVELDQHIELEKQRLDAAIGVVPISDFLGGANFPRTSIWDEPRNFLSQAINSNAAGKILLTKTYLTLAAVSAFQSAKLLSGYLTDMTSGVERTVAVLRVAKTAGQVAEVGLAVVSGYGLLRGSITIVTDAGAAAVTSEQATATKFLEELLRKDPQLLDETLEELPQTPYSRPVGGFRGGIKARSNSGVGQGSHVLY